MKFWITMGVFFAAFITSGVAGKNCGDGWQRGLMVMGETVLFWTLSIALVRRGLLKIRDTFYRRHLLSLSIKKA
jgi:hypothetical protein